MTIQYAPAAKVTPGSPPVYSVIYPSSGNCTTTAGSPFTESSSLINGDLLRITESVRVRMITPFFPPLLTFTVSGQRTIVKDISLVNADYYDLGLSTAELTANAALYNDQLTQNAAAASWAATQAALAGNSLTQTAIATWLAQTQTANANTYATNSAAIVGTYAANATALASTSTDWMTQTAFAAQVGTDNAIANATNTQQAYIDSATSAFLTAEAMGVTLTPSSTPTATGTVLYTDTPTPSPTATPTPTLAKVLNLQKWGTGSRCSGANSSRYIGLLWAKVLTTGTQGYYIYANGVLVGKTQTTTNKITRCGGSVSKNVTNGNSGCYNLLPSAWVPTSTVNYTVAAFAAGGAVVGPQSDVRVLTC